MTDHGAGAPAGLIASLGRLASTLTEIAQTRLELLSADLDEDREHLLALLLLALTALFCLGLGVLLATILVVATFWDILGHPPCAGARPALGRVPVRSAGGLVRGRGTGAAQAAPVRGQPRRTGPRSRGTDAAVSQVSDRHAARRAALSARAAAERAAVTAAIAPWRAPLAGLDLGLSALRFARQHPLGVLSGGFVFSAIGAGRVGRWLRAAWVVWQLVPRRHVGQRTDAGRR